MASKRILVIAGSDSSGGACATPADHINCHFKLTACRGLEADQKVIAAHQCYAMTATTALTAQNTLGVYDIHRSPPSFVAAQIRACAEDIGVDVVKIGMENGNSSVRPPILADRSQGMLSSAEVIDVVHKAFEQYKFKLSVIDPVRSP